MPNEATNQFYVHIPISVLNAEVPPNAMILYGHINALSQNEGYCWATNQFLADKFRSLSKGTVSKLIRDLTEAGLITYEVEDLHKRRIFIVRDTANDLEGFEF